MPRGTSKELLHEFLNEAMRRAKLVNSDHTAIVAVRMLMSNNDCAFLDCASKEDAEKALFLNRIFFWRRRVASTSPTTERIPWTFGTVHT